MPTLITQETPDKRGIARKASLSWGDISIIDTFFSEQPDPSVWSVATGVEQYLSTRTPSAPGVLRLSARGEQYYLSACAPIYPSEPIVLRLAAGGEQYLSVCRPMQVFNWISAVNAINIEVSVHDWLEKKENPYTQVGLLDNEEDQLLVLILRLKSSLSIPYRESLGKRLLTLFYDAKEEDFASPGITIDSLRNFYNFLKLHINLKCPTISLTPEYNIYATWKGANNRLFSIHFLPNGDVRFVIFKPNDRHTERKIRTSGVASVDVIMEIVKPYNVQDWVSE